MYIILLLVSIVPIFSICLSGLSKNNAKKSDEIREEMYCNVDANTEILHINSKTYGKCWNSPFFFILAKSKRGLK